MYIWKPKFLKMAHQEILSKFSVLSFKLFGIVIQREKRAFEQKNKK